MNSWEIDINCDVGEGIGNEADLFPFISSCNLSCGAHAGDLETIQKVISLAGEHGILIGAHPSYPDRENFGRVSLPMEAEALKKSIVGQIQQLETQVHKAQIELHHIKAHGALYNDISKNKELALIFLDCITPYKNSCNLYAPYGSVVAHEASKLGFTIVFEAFGDRNYNTDLSLVSRTEPNALILEPEQVLDHVVSMVKNGKVTSVNGTNVPIKASTICIHGDTPSALQILMYLSNELPKHHIHLKK
ncbi:MAG: 5-oxoprolinase subunit PxpA [Eudoraea sp.]|nr:5-oxoprolinase subunit PxpA [Eudoraea sp.]